MNKMPALVEVRDLKKYFPIRSGILKKEKKVVHAVDGVSFDIHRGENLGLVGESGCGKTTVARLLLRLIEPTSGRIHFMGQDILKCERGVMRKLRCNIQMIFQDPFASLNPRKTVLNILSQPYKIHRLHRKVDVHDRVSELLDLVGLYPTQEYINRYPHELSGGQRQRIGIARAIALNPKFIVADEPVSALDISIRAQILNLLKKLQKKLGITLLFITHDLSVVRSICNRVAVMYLGKIVEVATTDELFTNPLHPYTKAILSATPIPNPKKTRDRKRIILKGNVPSPINPPLGCRFHPRCPYSSLKCIKEEPQCTKVGNHFVFCHLLAE